MVCVTVDKAWNLHVVALLDRDRIREVEREVAVCGARRNIGYATSVAVDGGKQRINKEGLVLVFVVEVLIWCGCIDEVELEVLEFVATGP